MQGFAQWKINYVVCSMCPSLEKSLTIHKWQMYVRVLNGEYIAVYVCRFLKERLFYERRSILGLHFLTIFGREKT